MIGRFLVPLAIVLGIFVYMRDGDSNGASARIEQVCGADAGTVNVTIDWPPPAVAPDETWVDIGLAPSFAAGTFNGTGPIAPPQTNARVDGLPDNVTMFYRVNTRSQDTWRVHDSGSFETDCAAAARAAARATPTPAVDIVSSDLSR